LPWALLKHGLRRHRPAEAHLPPRPKLKRSYDVVIVGGGGHGLAAAYHLARDHGIIDVAVLDKGYLGGGNTARNTAIIRANYLTPEGVAFYKESVELWRDLSIELDINLMYAERGHLTLAHTDAALRTARWNCSTGWITWSAGSTSWTASGSRRSISQAAQATHGAVLRACGSSRRLASGRSGSCSRVSSS
jgi:glycine/D-amino acid oxidase-like deaminating enzyme